MAMLETLLATLSGLGGAGLGAAGALLVQRAKRRDDAKTAQITAAKADADLALERATTARMAARSWLTFVQRTLTDLRNRRGVDIQRFDEQMQFEQAQLTEAIYRLAALRPLELSDQRAAYVPDRPPFSGVVTNLSHLVREAVHRGVHVNLRIHEVSALLTEAERLRNDINNHAIDILQVASSAGRPSDVELPNGRGRRAVPRGGDSSHPLDDQPVLSAGGPSLSHDHQEESSPSGTYYSVSWVGDSPPPD